MGDKIIFATGNEGKMREIRMILADVGRQVLSMKEAGLTPTLWRMDPPLRRTP